MNVAIKNKSIMIREDLWRRARVNATLSGCSLQDYLAYLLESSEPVSDDLDAQALLGEIMLTNQRARGVSGDSSDVEPKDHCLDEVNH